MLDIVLIRKLMCVADKQTDKQTNKQCHLFCALISVPATLSALSTFSRALVATLLKGLVTAARAIPRTRVSVTFHPGLVPTHRDDLLYSVHTFSTWLVTSLLTHVTVVTGHTFTVLFAPAYEIRSSSHDGLTRAHVISGECLSFMNILLFVYICLILKFYILHLI